VRISTEIEGKIRLKQIAEKELEEVLEREKLRKNHNFTQTYPGGWRQIRNLADGNPGAVKLYSFFAEHIDATCGAVIADQQFLANEMGVNRSTIIRWLNYLEEKNAVLRIPITGKVCAYALNPNEVWKGYNTKKSYAAFITKTLVNKDGDIKRRIMAMFSPEEQEKENNCKQKDMFEN
jgi:hypothetical protein